MPKFTSVSGSDFQATTGDIIRTVTIIRIGLTTGRITDPITGRTTGTAGIVIIAIVIPIITGASLIGIATPGWLEAISSQPNFLSGNSLRKFGPQKTGRSTSLSLVKSPV